MPCGGGDDCGEIDGTCEIGGDGVGGFCGEFSWTEMIIFWPKQQQFKMLHVKKYTPFSFNGMITGLLWNTFTGSSDVQCSYSDCDTWIRLQSWESKLNSGLLT